MELRKTVNKRWIRARKTAMQTKNRNAMTAQQRPEGSDLKSRIVSVLSFDNFASLDSLTSYCLNPTVAMACG